MSSESAYVDLGSKILEAFNLDPNRAVGLTLKLGIDSASLEVEYMIGTGEYDALRSGDPLTDLKRFDLVERTPYFRRPVALDDSPEDDAAGVGS